MQPDRKRVDMLGKLLLMPFGVALGILLMLIAFPYSSLFNSDMVTFTVGMGDLFVAQPGTIAPPDNPHEVLSQHRLEFGEDGFRVPARPAEYYDVLALGDSYTEGANVALPWPDVLAAESGLAVRNMGFKGYGPVEEANVMGEYGADSGAEIVVMAFFGGNDVSNAESWLRRPDFVLPTVERSTDTEVNTEGEPWLSDHDGPFQYPVQMSLNGEVFEIAFLNSYVSWLNVEQEDLRQSLNLVYVIESWERISTAAGDACFIIVYFPSKPQIYLPYVISEHQGRIIEDLPQRAPDEPGRRMSKQDDPALTFEILMGRRNNMRDVIAETAASEGYIFLDLSPFFEEAAARGEINYYIYDTHINQAGQNLAGSVIADFIAQGGCGDS